MSDLTKTPPPYPNAPTHTKVTGYFNPLDMPFQLHIPELNRNILLQAREFIQFARDVPAPGGKTKRERIKINDPIFENYVGPNKLAREDGTDEVPIIWLPRPQLMPNPTNGFEFAGQQKFKTDEGGRVISPESVARAQMTNTSSVPSSASSITGYSMEQAEKLGIVRNASRGRMSEGPEKPVDNTPPQHTIHAPVPQAPGPRQPGAQRPVPPPFNPQVDEPLRAPASKSVPVAPAAQVKIPETNKVELSQSAQTEAPVAETVENLAPTEDLMADIPGDDGKITVEATDLGALSKQTAIAAGLPPATVVAVPSTTATTVLPVQPKVELPEPNIPAEPAPAPKQPRRTRREHADQPAVSTPPTPPAA